MSHLRLDLAVDHEATAPSVRAVIAAHLRETARRLDTTAGPIEIKIEADDLQLWETIKAASPPNHDRHRGHVGPDGPAGPDGPVGREES
jgi:hypothetical protein